MKKEMIFILPVILFLGMMCSCSRNQTVEIYTDNPGLVLIGEMFNIENPEYTVLFHYSKNIEANINERFQPDLVIGEYLNTAGLGKLYVPFGDDFPIDKLYPFLFCEDVEKISLMPISFSVPVILGKKKNMVDFDNPILTDVEEIRAKSVLFSQKNAQKTHMGFSPLWNDAFLYHIISLFSPNFKMLESGISDNITGIDDSIEYIRKWSEEGGYTVKKSIDFSERYRIIPDVELLLEERIGFSYCNIEEVMDLSMVQNEEVDYRYLVEGNKISLDRIVYAAIPKRGRNKLGARFFVRWLLDPEVQKRILEKQKKYSGEQKGFLIGFSSFAEVNEDLLPEFFPQLDGHIPPSYFFRDVVILPKDWHKLKTKIILPWFRDKIVNDSETTLSDFYNEWILHAVVE